MIAHIQGDLPLALRATRPETLPWEALASDFFALDPLFDKAVHGALEDFSRTTGRHCGALRTTHREALEFGIWLLARFGGGTIRVRQLRHRAWEKAILVTF